jgi:hypothetical protein
MCSSKLWAVSQTKAKRSVRVALVAMILLLETTGDKLTRFGLDELLAGDAMARSGGERYDDQCV